MYQKIQHAMKDMQAMVELLREVEPYVYRICYYLTGHHQDAEDLAQESMMKISRSLHTFRADSTLKTWIYQLVLNTYRDTLRSKKKVQTVELQETIPSISDFENQVTVKMMVLGFLKELTSIDRHIFVLRFLEDLPIKEVAALLDMKESTVKTRMLRLREKIRSSRLDFGGEV